MIRVAGWLHGLYSIPKLLPHGSYSPIRIVAQGQLYVVLDDDVFSDRVRWSFVLSGGTIGYVVHGAGEELP